MLLLEMENYKEDIQSRMDALATVIRAGAKATIEFRNEKYKYYYLACPCMLACGCLNRCRAWVLPTLRCYSDEELDKICEKGILQNIGYETIWFCRRCNLPWSCGLAKP